MKYGLGRGSKVLDDDDLDFTILACPSEGWVVSILGLMLVIFVAIAVSKNKSECAAKTCEHGSPILAHHECLCVERPVP